MTPAGGPPAPDPRSAVPPAPPIGGPPAAAVTGLSVTFGYRSRATEVVHGVNLRIEHGAAVGLVGGSGSGKSTVAKAMVGMIEPSAGRIEYDGVGVAALRRSRSRPLRSIVQLIPQDPYGSLDPRRTVGQSIAEAIDPKHARVARNRRPIERWLELVRLDPAAIDRFPHEFSGGQRQRVAIARALVVEPEIIIADEITSSLDVSVQAEILGLVSELRATLNLTLLVISHNLAVVREVCERVVVLHEGRVVDHGPTVELFDAPSHPYTRSLLAAVPGAPGFSLDRPSAGGAGRGVGGARRRLG